MPQKTPDLKVGQWVIITGGPYEGREGEVIDHKINIDRRGKGKERGEVITHRYHIAIDGRSLERIEAKDLSAVLA